MDIAAWLRELGLERYQAAFRDNEIDAEVLPELTDVASDGPRPTARSAPKAPEGDRSAARRRFAAACPETSSGGAGTGFRRRAAAADGDILRFGRLDGAIGAARSGGSARGDWRLSPVLRHGH